MQLAIKALAIAGVAPLLASATVNPVVTSTSLTVPSPFGASFFTVPRLDCGPTRGSGVRVSDDIIITAAHVIDAAACMAYGLPTTLAYQSKHLDFAAVRMEAPSEGVRAVISCDGIVEGQVYSAMGYPNGEAPDVELLIGTAKRNRGQVTLIGRAYHGMSGGAIVDSNSRVVAILNAINPDYSYTFVTPLSDTYLCGARA